MISTAHGLSRSLNTRSTRPELARRGASSAAGSRAGAAAPRSARGSVGATSERPLSTRDTVGTETPASAAITLIVTLRSLATATPSNTPKLSESLLADHAGRAGSSGCAGRFRSGGRYRAVVTRTLRSAIVGTGGIAGFHAASLERLGRSRIVAATDVDAGRLAAFGEKWSVPRLYPDLDALLAAESPDLVHLCTPPDCTRRRRSPRLAAGASGAVREAAGAEPGRARRGRRGGGRRRTSRRCSSTGSAAARGRCAG